MGYLLFVIEIILVILVIILITGFMFLVVFLKTLFDDEVHSAATEGD